MDLRGLIRDDPYSDRIRLDVPQPGALARDLPERLETLAEEQGRGRIVSLVPAGRRAGFEQQGYQTEALMPDFYKGEQDCAVLGLALDPKREQLANPEEVERVDAILAQDPTPTPREHTPTRRAAQQDAPQIAALLQETFEDYPTPTTTTYVRAQLEQGTPFRLIEDGGEIVACASADLFPEAMSAELTDCATRPDYRGRGYMQSILRDLIGDLEQMRYPTAFTMARARIVGMNLAFQRLGFTLRGRMAQSCRIGEGLEDMNVWSARLNTI